MKTANEAKRASDVGEEHVFNIHIISTAIYAYGVP